MTNRNPTYFFFINYFIILKLLNLHSSITNRNPTYFFFINYFYNFKTFKPSFKYHKKKSYLLFFINYFIILKHLNLHSSITNRNPTYFFFINYFYNFKTFKPSFKYHKKKSYVLFFKIIFIILKHLNLHSSITNRNPNYFFFINYFYNFKTFKPSFKYHKQKSYLLFIKNYFIILKHLNLHSSITNRNPTSFF